MAEDVASTRERDKDDAMRTLVNQGGKIGNGSDTEIFLAVARSSAVPMYTSSCWNPGSG